MYFPWMSVGYHSEIPAEVPPGIIFFTEALAACTAVHKVADFSQMGQHVKRLGIYSDNTNTVSIFNSL
ncbi:hypothetical protein CERSUDRAFT_59199 [Gelatoporia subvermispora B]|uniref:Uncharacterized protein n=1 Tax=Ceriporiopsis subvermispora (strain B) TaxID=914234 RepID=M2Q5A4_CERS8|nr:hypothetical protein CERSUDRAFT_59199 [Gelatoporia subvermispora B]